MTTSLSNLFKFVLGFTLAILLLFLAGAGLTRYLLTRVATPPPRPSFPNDSPPTVAASPAAPPPSPVAEAPPSPEPSPPPTPQGYRARVIQPIGLILRQQPGSDAPQIGGVEYNRDVIVLEDSPDGSWQKIRLGETGPEGWVKAGNLERLE